MKASSNHNPIKHNKNLGLISKALYPKEINDISNS